MGAEKLTRLERLGATFNDVAAVYDEMRPGYPIEIVDAIVAQAELPPRARSI